MSENPLVGADRLAVIRIDDQTTYSPEDAARIFEQIHDQGTDMDTTASQQSRKIEGTKDRIQKLNTEIKDIQTTATVQISGVSGTVSLEEAERLVKTRETDLKDEQDQRSLNRGLARDQRIGGGSGK